jgi:hypothetical protein
VRIVTVAHSTTDRAGFLANLVTLNLPASNLITRRTLGWEPAQPSLLADLVNGHYFSAG